MADKFQVVVLNYSAGFREASEALHYGLLEAGYDSKLTGVYQFRDHPKRRRIVLASQLGKTLRTKFPGTDWRQLIRENDIVYNAGQLRESLIAAQENDEIYRERIIWDFSALNVEFLYQRGCREAVLVPLGDVAALHRIPKHAYDADVIFYGVVNNRRRHILDELKNTGLRCRFFDQLSPVWGVERDELIGRTKIVLNIHFYEYKIFEVLRAFYPLINGRCMISESGPDQNQRFYQDAVVFCDYDQIVDKVLQLSADDSLITQQEERAQVAMSKIPQADILFAVLNSA